MFLKVTFADGSTASLPVDTSSVVTIEAQDGSQPVQKFAIDTAISVSLEQGDPLVTPPADPTPSSDTPAGETTPVDTPPASSSPPEDAPPADSPEPAPDPPTAGTSEPAPAEPSTGSDTPSSTSPTTTSETPAELIGDAEAKLDEAKTELSA